ncbi:phospholipase [Halobaculum sp. CBA1158]|uniref:alpha/beta hydrolase n=1 Tax=Halobaculum sp. CBA1158 TaxID=2904243 RepID=UPI001F26051C|nr:phospholipase [Halobaculum sp. CBA1158]UIP00592.1 phospholipase [Halobaculum sp. CBA1158]
MFPGGRLPSDLPGPHAGRPVVTAGAPRGGAEAAVVALHGRGATAQGVINLLDPLADHGLAFVAPHADRSRWFPYAADEPRERNERHVASAVAVASTTLSATQERLALPPERVLLLGFSQGGCVAAECAAREGGSHPVAVLNGTLLGPTVAGDDRTDDGDGTEVDSAGDDDRGDYQGDLAGTPVLVAGGADDERVPPARLRATARVLRDLGGDVTERVYDGVGHHVVDGEFEWVERVLANAREE